MANQTDPLASGLQTSEGKLTVALCLVGLALEGFSASLTQKMAEYPDVKWVAIAALLAGVSVQVLSVLGYNKDRASLKANAIVSALAAGVPVAVTAISNALLKNLPPTEKTQAAVAASVSALEATKEAGPQLATAAKAAAQKDLKESP